MKLHAAVGVTLVLASALLTASQAPAPTPPQGQSRPGAPGPGGIGPRTPGPAVAQGNGRITGRVLSDEGRPLRGAQVTARCGANRRAHGGRTDVEGRYEVKNLPEAECSLVASKPGYVRMPYGAKPGGAPTSKPVRVATSQTVEKIDFQLPRACVISGHVFDEFGEPAGEAAVEPLRPGFVGGRRIYGTSSMQRAQTDDLGQFRLYGLEPGDYIVRAQLDVGPRTEDRSAYPPTFYPATTQVNDAARVPCRAGQETPGVQVSLARVPTATVSGSVRDSQGRPAAITLRLTKADDATFAMSRPARVEPDGSFIVTNVVAGNYRLTAMSALGRSSAQREMAVMDLTVGRQDVAGVFVQLARGGTARGRVVAADNAEFDFPLSRLRVITTTDQDAFMMGASASVTDEGVFEVPDIFGARRLEIFGLPENWGVKSFQTKDGESSQPIAFPAGETVDGLEFVLTNRVTVLSGAVTDHRNRPVTDYVVGVFPEDPAQWAISGRARMARADENGRYQVKRLPPGRYLAAAVTEIPREQWGDPEYFERLKPGATLVTLAEGEAKTLDLKLIEQ